MGKIANRFVNSRKKIKPEPLGNKVAESEPVQSTSQELIEVYRLEIPIHCGNRTRTYGPFTAGAYGRDLERVLWKYRDALTYVKEPAEDGINLSYGEDLMCGCEAKDLHLWIPNHWIYKELCELGFKLNKYVVKECDLRIGGTQVVWHVDDGELIGEVDFRTTIKEHWRSKRRVDDDEEVFA